MDYTLNNPLLENLLITKPKLVLPLRLIYCGDAEVQNVNSVEQCEAKNDEPPIKLLSPKSVCEDRAVESKGNF